MEKYIISLENYMSNEKRIDTTVSSTKQVLEQYKSINWFNLLTKATPENQNDSDIVEDNSWNFSVSFKRNRKEYILHIHPHLYPSPSVQPNQIKLVLEYMSSNIVPTSKLSQFFGGSKEKSVKEHQTAATGVLQDDALTHLSNFLDGNLTDLHRFGSLSLSTITDESYKVY
ncbi:hypothetical protein [Cellulophaga omnivescoria]|uniref:hypothetical protein n=1 Tax=Cellulophaga omnivescoria TaxID=1888890 RepID=UPI00098736BB|nr:hypothetical protein [Cellulophaga omnivescoria]WBU90310.1 hypothetical protein PBN93_04675 [Cellulophaga omnivescoria]WKB82429.1 hypothetical protein QYR09_05205 [Cellulophaga lytica]